MLAATSSMFSQLVIKGQIIPRTEYSHGYKALAAPDQDASLFTAQRSRLIFNYSAEKYKVGLVLQDVRAWGSQEQLVKNEDYATSVHEAWAEVMFTDKFSLKAGRQEVVYDDHRIFGNVGWAPQARSHDMAIFKYEDAVKIHFGLAYNQDDDIKTNLYTVEKSYKAMQFAWFNKKTENLNFSFLLLNNGKAFIEFDDDGTLEQTIQYSQTLGPRIVYKAGKLGASLNFYYQMGKDGADRDISAYDLGVDISFKASDMLSFNAGIELLSGTAYDETDNKSFTPFYGTNHKFNGFMDYFYVGNHVGSVGLQDIYVKGKFKKGKVFAAGHVHLFSAAADLNDGFDRALGTEIDLFGGYTLTKEVNIKLGYSHMLGTESMTKLRGGDDGETSNWAWLMLTVTPTFFSGK